MTTRGVLIFVCALTVACGHKSAGVGGDHDAGGLVDASSDGNVNGDGAVAASVCGNNVVEPGEDCDDGDNTDDSFCLGSCHFTCGNGIVDSDFGETCDVAVTDGPGACATTCDDGVACTSDVQIGAACTTACVHGAITDAADDDACCPDGASANTDNDCIVTCGNGVIEGDELCDTGITSGVGACPTSCTNGPPCTTGALVGTGCEATCTSTPIITPINGDGCCPAGASSTNDNDCVAGCGNGIVGDGETCDTAITSGVGKCPTTCSDGIACTKDTLVTPGTCTATCAFVPITLPKNDDGCCPTGANSTNDNDCAATVTPVAFRITDLDLRDPHIFVNAFGCHDVTDTPFFGFSVNDQLQASIQTDTDKPADGKLNLSIVSVFRPLDQGDGHTTPLEINFATCTAPIETTMCVGTTAKTVTTATTHTMGTCLDVVPKSVVHVYPTPVAPTTGPCYVSAPTTLTITLAGTPVTLQEGTIAATYVGSPASSTVSGLMRGFLSETDANNTLLPSTLPLIGGQPLSTLLPGGDPPGDKNTNCASFSDVDMNGTVRGWWFYLNFTATKVTWSDP